MKKATDAKAPRHALRAKPASQRRSQHTRERLLAALDRLLRIRPFEQIGVTELAREAGVAAATLYQRFSNTHAMAAVLLELYYRSVEDWAHRPRRPAAVPPSLYAALHAIAVDGVRQVQALGHVMRPAYLYSRQHPERVGADWSRLEGLAQRGFEALLDRYAADVQVPDRQRAAAVLCRLFNLQLLGPLLHGKPEGKRFAEELATLAYRYIAFPAGTHAP